MYANRTTKKQKVIITELLQNTIKKMRKDNNKRGDELSKQLGRGASYISQIENNKIKEIEFDILIQIFETILNLSNTAFNEYMNNYINGILINISKNELIKENWIHLFIVQEIEFDITDFAVDFLKNKLEELNKTPQDLVRIINKNAQLDEIFYEMTRYTPNKAYINASCTGSYTDDEYDLTIRVYYDMEENFVSKIISKTIRSINYINMYTIFFNLFKLETDHLPEVYEKTSKIMYDNNFFDTFDTFDILHQTKKINDPETNTGVPFNFYDELIINYQEKYSNLKKELFEKLEFALQQYYDANSAYSCEKMEEIMRNMESDAGLIMAILSSPLYNLPQFTRHNFVNEYRKLLNHFSNPIIRDKKADNNSRYPK